MKVEPKIGYCMNLDNRTDRWMQVTKDFERLSKVMNISIERVPAIAIPLKPQDGVTETVKKIIKTAKEQNLPYVLILEDDLFVIDADKVVKCLNNAPEDWDLLSGGVYYYCQDSSFNDDWMKLKDFCAMHFIIIKNSVYDTILNMKINGNHIDRLLGNEVKNKKLKMYVMYPMPCQQKSSFSNLRGRIVNDNTKNLPWVNHPDRLR